MKIRGGFVSNSSSSSFVISNSNNITATQLSELLKKTFPDVKCGWYVNEDIYNEDCSFKEDVAIIDVQNYKTLAYRCLKEFTDFTHDVFDICDYENGLWKENFNHLVKKYRGYINHPEKIDKKCKEEVARIIKECKAEPSTYAYYQDRYFGKDCTLEDIAEKVEELIRTQTEEKVARTSEYLEFRKNFREKVEKNPRIRKLEGALKLIDYYSGLSYTKDWSDLPSSAHLLDETDRKLDEGLRAIKCEECIRSGCAICGKKYATLWDEVSHCTVAVITGENSLPYEVHEFLIEIAKANGTDSLCFPHLG